MTFELPLHLVSNCKCCLETPALHFGGNLFSPKFITVSEIVRPVGLCRHF